MKFTINTTKFNSMLSKAQRGVGNSRIMSITEYLRLELFDGTLSVTATDMSNFITVSADDIEGEYGIAVVKADVLSKLASKTTKSEMKFELHDAHLEVKGNGVYKLPVMEVSDFPTYTFDKTVNKVEVEVSKLKRVFQVNKSAIAMEMLMPCLTGFNVGERVVTTDGVKMCINNNSVFNKPVLIPQTLADLLGTLSSEKVAIQQDGNKLLFQTEHITIMGTELDGVTEYPDILPILDIQHTGMVVVSKTALQNALDRLSLFVNEIDNNGVLLQFNTGHLVLEDLKKNSTEEIEMEQHVSSEREYVKLAVNLKFLQDLLSVAGSSKVELHYGEGMPIKIVEEDVVQILSVMSIEGEEV